MPKLTIIFAAAIAFILSLAAVRAAELTPELDAELRAKSQKILDATPGAATFWRVEEAGTLVHKQSGLPCVAALPPFTLTAVALLPKQKADGDHIACQYGGDGMKARTTLFLLPYQGEDIKEEFNLTISVMLAMGNGEPDNVVSIGNIAGGNPLAGSVKMKDKSGSPVKNALWMNKVADWKYKIRMTYPDSPETNAKAELAGVLMWAAGANNIAAAAE